MKLTRLCPRTNCDVEMSLVHVAETDFDSQYHKWTYVFYYCSSCNRSVMVSRTTDTVLDKEGRV